MIASMKGSSWESCGRLIGWPHQAHGVPCLNEGQLLGELRVHHPRRHRQPESLNEGQLLGELREGVFATRDHLAGYRPRRAVGRFDRVGGRWPWSQTVGSPLTCALTRRALAGIDPVRGALAVVSDGRSQDDRA